MSDRYDFPIQRDQSGWAQPVQQKYTICTVCGFSVPEGSHEGVHEREQGYAAIERVIAPFAGASEDRLILARLAVSRVLIECGVNPSNVQGIADAIVATLQEPLA